MKLLVLTVVIFSFSLPISGQFDSFCFELGGEYKVYQTSIQAYSGGYDFKSLDNSSLFGFGIKRSIGYVDHLINLGLIVQYGYGNYKKETVGFDKFRNYHVGAIIDYEKSIGLKATAHPYSTYPIVNVGVNYLWQAVEFKSLDRLITEVNQTFFRVNNPRILIGGGLRLYSRKQYKGTLKLNFYYDLPTNNWTSSRENFIITSIDTYGIRLSYSVSN